MTTSGPTRAANTVRMRPLAAVRSLGVASLLVASACASTTPPLRTPAEGRASREQVHGAATAKPSMVASWVEAPDERLQCPRLGEFRARVQSRLAAGHSLEGVKAQLELRESAHQIIGQLRLSGPATAVRTVSGQSCDEVVTALALVTALRLLALPRKEVEASPSTPRDTVATATVTAPQGSNPHPLARAVPPADASASSQPSASAIAIEDLTLHGGYASVPAPGPTAGLRFGMSLGPTSPLRWALSIAYAQGQSATFSTHLAFAQLDVCSRRLAVSGTHWQLCGLAQAGASRAQASTSALGDSAPTWGPRVAAGAGAHLVVPISKAFRLRLLAEGTVRVYQDDYYVAGLDENRLRTGEDAASFSPTPAGFTTGIGLGYDL